MSEIKKKKIKKTIKVDRWKPIWDIFILEYLIDMNASAAYRRSGFKTKNPDVDAQRLMVKPSIKEKISNALAERSRRTGISADRVLEEIAKMAFFNIANIVNDDGTLKPISQISQADACCIQEIVNKTTYSDHGETVEKKVKIIDKNANLTLLCKHLGLAKERVEISVDEGLAEKLKAARGRVEAAT